MGECNIAEIEKSTFEELDKKFWLKPERSIETSEEIRERLENIGVERIDLHGLQEKFQYEIADCTEKMYETFPQLRGYINTIKSADLPSGVLACSGPRFEGDEYKGAELQFNRNFFGNKKYSLDIVSMESNLNWRGESWLSGKGGQGVISHEIGHVMALQLNAEKVDIKIGEHDSEKLKELQEQYMRNYEINQICMQSIKEIGISINDIGKELSTYGAHDFGEMFAECVSEVQSKRNARRLAVCVVNNYESIVNGRG